MNIVRVNRHGAGRIADGHPWVYRSDIVDAGDATPGDSVTVVDSRGRALCTAHYSSTSQIALRLLSRSEEPIDRGFFHRRIGAALDHRTRVVSGAQAYRLVYSEADRLPGLIVDRYGDYLVVQTLTQGMERAKEDVAAALADQLSPAGIVERNDAPARRHEELPPVTGTLAGEVPPTVNFRMNGLCFEANLLTGQKTGSFLDQRENYLAAARYARGPALDCFTSTGGFALHIAGNCDRVEAIDSSETALATAARNATANAIANVDFRQADVFNLLTGYAATNRRFSTVILDPPAFAKTRSAVRSAMRAYRDLNFRALQLLGSGGVLVTCSCSHHLSEAALVETVTAAAIEHGKTLRVLERRTQSSDHPVLLTVPETLYLKCLILQVL